MLSPLPQGPKLCTSISCETEMKHSYSVLGPTLGSGPDRRVEPHAGAFDCEEISDDERALVLLRD